MGQILLVRHGQASFGSSNYDQLSARGESQARLLGRWFSERGQKLDRVVSGTMQRHLQTAQACLGMLANGPVATSWQTDSGFNEYDHDAVLHRYRPQFAEPGEVRRFIAAEAQGSRAFAQIFQDAMARWMHGAHDAEYDESWPAFRQRCVAALQRLAVEVAASPDSQTTIVFSSGGTIATLCQHLLRIPDPQVFALNWTLVNSGVTKLYYRRTPSGDAPRNAQPHLTLGYLNNYAHLEALGDADAVTYR